MKTTCCGSADSVRDGAGFSRLDGLVLVALALGLAAVWLPAGARPRADSQALLCLHNVALLNRAMQMYASDFQGYLPPNPDDANTTPYANWVGGQAGSGGPQEFNPDVLKDPARSRLWTYLDTSVSVFRCPADQRQGRYQGTNPDLRGKIVPSARSFSLNGAMGTNPYRSGGKVSVDGPWLDGNHGHTPNRTWYTYARLTDMSRPGPARTFTFIDEDQASINDGTFAMVGPDEPQRYEWLDWPGTRHNLAGTIGFGDGHVELHRWQDPRTRVKGGNVSRQIQPDNPDIRWLSERTSAKIR